MPDPQPAPRTLDEIIADALSDAGGGASTVDTGKPKADTLVDTKTINGVTYKMYKDAEGKTYVINGDTGARSEGSFADNGLSGTGPAAAPKATAAAKPKGPITRAQLETAGAKFATGFAVLDGISYKDNGDNSFTLKGAASNAERVAASRVSANTTAGVRDVPAAAGATASGGFGAVDKPKSVSDLLTGVYGPNVQDTMQPIGSGANGLTEAKKVGATQVGDAQGGRSAMPLYDISGELTGKSGVLPENVSADKGVSVLGSLSPFGGHNPGISGGNIHTTNIDPSGQVSGSGTMINYPGLQKLNPLDPNYLQLVQDIADGIAAAREGRFGQTGSRGTYDPGQDSGTALYRAKHPDKPGVAPVDFGDVEMAGGGRITTSTPLLVVDPTTGRKVATFGEAGQETADIRPTNSIGSATGFNQEGSPNTYDENGKVSNRPGVNWQEQATDRMGVSHAVTGSHAANIDGQVTDYDPVTDTATFRNVYGGAANPNIVDPSRAYRESYQKQVIRSEYERAQNSGDWATVAEIMQRYPELVKGGGYEPQPQPFAGGGTITAGAQPMMQMPPPNPPPEVIVQSFVDKIMQQVKGRGNKRYSPAPVGGVYGAGLAA